MDYKQNLLFFDHKRTKRWTTVSYFAYPFFAVAAFMLFMSGGWVAAALPAAIPGVVILVLALNMFTSEKHIKGQIDIIRKKAEEEALAYLDHPNQNPDLFFIFEGYDRMNDTLTLRKNRNGRVFSTVYVVTYMLIEGNNLRVWQGKFSLIEDKVDVFAKDIPMNTLSEGTLLNESRKQICIDNVEHEIPTVAVVVHNNDHSPAVIADCMIYSYDMERFIGNLSHGISRAKTGK
ncbi:MAG: hypothetical protein IKC63_00100 [Clostridia bacterium]|nr:hypothetical protein [Clostridia bacterium]